MVFNFFCPDQAVHTQPVSSGSTGIAALPYRANVGIVLVNHSGRVFVGKRSDQPDPDSGWQMPQGGIDDGETLEQALWRELGEEIGTRKAEMIASYPRPLFYDFPEQLQPKIYGGLFRGQEQHWFLLRFTGTDSDITLSGHDGQAPEFSAYEWKTPDAVIALAVPFKRKIYESILYYFEEYIRSASR